MQCHTVENRFFFPYKKWTVAFPLTGTWCIHDFFCNIARTERVDQQGHHRSSNSTRTKSAGQQTVQAKQQFKKTIGRSADSTSQATVQEHNQQVSRQYRPSNSTEIQRSATAGKHFCPPPPTSKLEHACSNISPGWKSGKHSWKVAGLHILSIYTEFSPPVTQRISAVPSLYTPSKNGDLTLK